MLEGLVSMDRKTRTILAVNGYLHSKRNVARLYLPRKEGMRVDWYWGVLEGEKTVAWLPERYHGKGVCWRRRSSGLLEKKGRGESQQREAPQREFATKTSDVAGEESCEFLRNGLLRRENKAKQCKGLVWKIRPFAWHFLKYIVISHQFVLPTFFGMCYASKLLDAAEKWEDQEKHQGAGKNRPMIMIMIIIIIIIIIIIFQILLLITKLTINPIYN